MRLDPDSRCSTSSQAVKEALLSLLHKLRPRSNDPKVGKILIHRRETFWAPEETGHRGNLTARTDVLLKMLFSGTTSLSNELAAFLEKMNIWKSCEMDTLQESLKLMSVFLKVCHACNLGRQLVILCRNSTAQR